MPGKRRTHPLDQSPLYKLGSRGKLCRLLGITAGELRAVSKGDALYREFDITKKSGGLRHVENPDRPLKLVQASIARRLASIAPPDYLYCPVKGRCYVSNAARHVGNRVVRCLDIKSFFPNTPSRRVYWFYRSVLRCSSDLAGLLAKLSTYKGHLPTGSPLSPILAYFAYHDVWARVAALCVAKGHTLTLYVDDLTISGARVGVADLWLVKRELHRAGLHYHKEKLFRDRPAEVTGVIVGRGGVAAPNRQCLKLHTARREVRELEGDARVSGLGRIGGLNAQLTQISRKNAKPPRSVECLSPFVLPSADS